MQLTRLQRGVLTRYQEFHVVPPTVGKFIVLSLVKHSVRLMVFGALIAVSAATFSDVRLPLFLVGLLVGSMGRDIAHFRYTVYLWPTLELVMDWNKTDELLQASDPTQVSNP